MGFNFNSTSPGVKLMLVFGRFPVHYLVAFQRILAQAVAAGTMRPHTSGDGDPGAGRRGR